MDDVQLKNVSSASALRILEEIHKGNNSFDGLERALGNMVGFNETLNYMSRSNVPDHHLLMEKEVDGKTKFTIKNSFHGLWSLEIRKWMRDNAYMR